MFTPTERRRSGYYPIDRTRWVITEPNIHALALNAITVNIDAAQLQVTVPKTKQQS